MPTPSRICLASLLVLLSVLASPRRARAIGEQTGRIKGIVSDAQSGARLPGATVSASSTAMIGGARSVLTDESGRYELDNLPPGLYRLEISYPDTLANVRTATVQPGVATQVNVAWAAESGTTESVRLIERTPLTRPDSTEAGALLRYPALAKLPTGRSYQNVTQLVAGVAPDPNSRNPNPAIKGGLSMFNHYLVDGLDITDPETGSFSTNLSFDSTEAVDVLTSGMEAQYNSLSGVINVITRSGADEAHVNASAYGSLGQLAAKSAYGASVYDGIQPFSRSPVADNQAFQFSLTAGGPIVKQRLWVSGSYELRLSEQSVVKAPPLGVPPLSIQHPPYTTIEHLGRLKVTYAPNQKHRINVSANANPVSANNATGGNSSLGVAENRQDLRTVFGVISWDWFAGPRVSTNVRGGFLWEHLDNGPQGMLGDIDTTGCQLFDPKNCAYDANRAQHVNTVDGTVWYQGGARQINDRYRVQLDPSVTLLGHLLGRHDVKAGLQLEYTYRFRDYSTPGEFVFFDRTTPGRPLEAGLCDPVSNPDACLARTRNSPFRAHGAGLGAGLYLQDRWWTPLSRLTVVPGLRFDWGRTTDRKGRTASNLFSLAPRLGAIVDLTGDGRATAFAQYGRHTETLSLLTASVVDYGESSTSETLLWDPDKKDFTIPAGVQGGATGIVVDHHAKTPHMDEVSGGVRAEIAPSSSLELDYTYRHYANLWAAVETNRIWDPTGTRPVGWLDPGKTNQDVYVLTTPDDNERTYHGFDLIAQGSPTQNWDFGASYTLSWLYGSAVTIYGQSAAFHQYDNRRQKRFYDGFLPGDIRHSLKLFGSYTFRDRLSVGLNVAYLTGVPLTKTYSDAGVFNFYRSPLGTEPGQGNDIQGISEFRTPDRATVDLRVVCNVLPRRLRHTLNLIADVFNAFDRQAPTSLEVRDLPTFGQATSTRQSPLRVQLGLQYLR
jgi:hypothetical protein